MSRRRAGTGWIVLLTVAAGGGMLPARARSATPAWAVRPERLEAISRRYLGTPYRLDCLGEGRAPDADPLFTRKFVDCQTLVEQVMAEAVAPWNGGLGAACRLIRYRGAEVALENRHHYCVPDWLTHPWPARDITPALRGASLSTAQRRIDRGRFLASRGGDGRKPVPVEKVKTAYIPRAAIRAASRSIPHGTIGVFVLNRDDIVAGHVGFLFRKNGEVVFRHASQGRKKVIDEPLLGYVARAPRKFIGMKVLQPDAAGLRRRAPHRSTP